MSFGRGGFFSCLAFSCAVILRSPLDGQRDEPAELLFGIPLKFRFGYCEPQGGESADEAAETDLELHSHQLRTDAEM